MKSLEFLKNKNKTMFDENFENKDVFGIWAYFPFAIIMFFLFFYKIIQKSRHLYMKKQMHTVRTILKILASAPLSTEQEYANWRNGNLKSMKIDSSCGLIFETSQLVSKLKVKIGPEASMILLLYFLDLCKDPLGEKSIGPRACRWARIIGTLPNLYICKIERTIMAKFLSEQTHKENMLMIMMYMCNPECMITAKMYLLFREGKNLNYNFSYFNRATQEVIKTEHYHPRFSLPLLRTLSVLPDGFPSIFYLDVQYHNDRSCSVQTEWIEKVRQARVALWGESGVSIERLLTLVGCLQLDAGGNCNIGSVLSYVGKYIHKNPEEDPGISYIEPVLNLSCPICIDLQSRIGLAKLNCKHCLNNKPSILNWLKNEGLCPICTI